METMKYFELTPSIGGSFSYGWKKMFEKAFLPLLLAVIIVGLLNGPASATWKSDGHFGLDFLFFFPVIVFGLAYAFLFLPIIEYGENYLFLKAMRGEETNLVTLFDGFKYQYLNIILARLIVVGLVIIGFIMLIIPGIIIACRLGICAVFGNG
jgi:hypothetical protein